MKLIWSRWVRKRSPGCERLLRLRWDLFFFFKDEDLPNVIRTEAAVNRAAETPAASGKLCSVVLTAKPKNNTSVFPA